MFSASYFIFAVTIIFAVVFTLKLSRAKRQSKASRDFWEKERQANSVRRVDPDTIEYIKIPLEALPFQETSDKELSDIQDTVKNLAQERLLNLTGLTNTDIKFRYGTANLSLVSECDQRFTVLARTLHQWAGWLLLHEQPQEAKAVLEYAVSCQADISNIYTLLADIYLQEEQPEKIADLILSAEKLSSLMKDSIIRTLKEKLTFQ